MSSVVESVGHFERAMILEQAPARVKQQVLQRDYLEVAAVAWSLDAHGTLNGGLEVPGRVGEVWKSWDWGRATSWRCQTADVRPWFKHEMVYLVYTSSTQDGPSSRKRRGVSS